MYLFVQSKVWCTATKNSDLQATNYFYCIYTKALTAFYATS